MKKWNYEPLYKIDSGYEDLWDDLEKYTKQRYDLLDEKGKEALIEEVFSIYRSRNVFPTFYYNKEGIIEEIRKCRDKILPAFDGEILDKRPTQGTTLLKYLFPNFFDVVCKNDEENTLIKRFYDDHKLKRAIKFCFEFKAKVAYPVTPTSLRMGIEMIGSNIPTNFLPMKVKMLVDYYMKEGEKFLDFSCGFGGRMLGTLSSTKNLHYYGFEPNTDTFNNLLKLNDYIQLALNESNRVHIYNQGSEENLPEELIESMDFCMSSPPYFNLEKYSDEESQCYIKYPNLEEWVDNYVNKTIQNIYKSLKPNKYYAVNINDFKIGNNEVKFVEKWIELSKFHGFTLEKVIPMKLGKQRPNSNSEFNSFISKEESIYLFKK